MRAQINSSATLSEPARRSWKGFFLVSHLLGESVDRALAKAGVGPQTEYDVLYTLQQARDNRLTIKEISASVALSHSGLSRLIDRLEAQGYVVRCEFAEDRRAVGVRLLPAGEARIDHVWAAMSAEVEAKFARSLTDDEHGELLRLMQKLLPPLIEEKERMTGLPFLHKL